MYGVTPTRENMTQRLMPYVVNIYNLGCTPGVSPAVIADWLKLENRPDELQDWSDDDLVDSDPETNREMLIGEFEREVERLQAIEKQVMLEVDQPSLQNVLDRASILTEADARRVARSHSESRTTYHKAAKDLWPMLEREQEQGPAEPAGDDDSLDGDDTVTDVAVAAPVAASALSGQPVAFADPLSEGGSGDEGSESTDEAQPAPEWVATGSGSACGEDTAGSQIEPEDLSWISAQQVDSQEGSVDVEPSGSGLQNGVLGLETAHESTRAGIPASGVGVAGQASEPSPRGSTG